MKQRYIKVAVDQYLHEAITEQAQNEHRTVPKSVLVVLKQAYAGPMAVAKALRDEHPTD